MALLCTTNQIDEDTGIEFYFNNTTEQSTWEEPGDLGSDGIILYKWFNGEWDESENTWDVSELAVVNKKRPRSVLQKRRSPPTVLLSPSPNKRRCVRRAPSPPPRLHHHLTTELDEVDMMFGERRHNNGRQLLVPTVRHSRALRPPPPLVATAATSFGGFTNVPSLPTAAFSPGFSSLPFNFSTENTALMPHR